MDPTLDQPRPRPTRTERDSLGDVEVPDDRLWGAQTQRSLTNFVIGRDRFVMRPEVIHALAEVKAAAAAANAELGDLTPDLADLVGRAADEVARGEHDDQFPLVVFQTGSGTQTNMNLNEVIANRANQLAGAPLGARSPVHPNDHVNMSQSSNDTFPTAMHVTLARALRDVLAPAIDELLAALADRADAHGDLVMVGRTHLQDATPIRLGQVIGSWATQVAEAWAAVERSGESLRRVAIGGTAVGTGLGSRAAFGPTVCRVLTERTGIPFQPADDRVAALASHDAIATLSGALRTLAGALGKVANDVRWYASGPRTGLGELRLPANEPGSSIMPGKVNPTQSEAMLMVVARVFGNDATVAMAASQGSFQLNVAKPIIVDATLESICLLAEAVRSFADHAVAGLEPVPTRIAAHLADDLMLVTALAPEIGYDAAAAIAKEADAHHLTLREAALGEGAVSADTYDRLVDPRAMTEPRG